MDPDGRQTADGGTDDVLDDNVVRLPRDWLGPRDELIPIGGSANGQSEASVPEPTASDFWGEGSAALQTALAVAPSRWVSGRIRAAATVAASIAALVAVAVFATGGSHRRLVSNDVGSQPATELSFKPTTVAHTTRNRALARREHTRRRATHRARHVTRTRTVIEQVHYTTAPATSSSTPVAPETPIASAGSSSSGGQSSAGAGSQPAVGVNGALGPGTSPDG